MKKCTLVLSVLLVSSGGMLGCGSDASSDSGSAAGVTCDAFTNVGTAITPSSNPGAPPSMMGGPLVEGTYALTSFAEYNGVTASSMHKETFVFANGTMKHAEAKDAGDEILAGTYSTAGTTITLNITCPQTQSLDLQYTATPTTFAFVAPDNSNQIQTYTLQQ